MRTSFNLVLALLLAVGSSNVRPALVSVEQAFMDSVARHLPARERSQWEAYVARERVTPDNYFPFGSGACEAMAEGRPEESVVENFSEFFGPVRAKAFVMAAKEIICPTTQK